MFDIRRIEVHSVKDFLPEYLMIVLGILTALGLEHLVTIPGLARRLAGPRARGRGGRGAALAPAGAG